MTCDIDLAHGVATVVVIVLGWEGAQIILRVVLDATLGRWFNRRNGREG